MANAGGGKMRPKRLHGASKPYQRTRPKSILERVKDFVTPSWLSNLWSTDSEDNRPPSRAYSARLPTSTANSIPLQPGLPDGHYFGLRDIDSQTGNSAEMTQTEWQRFRSPAYEPDDANTPVLTPHEGLSVPVSTSTPIELDEDVVVVDAGEGPSTQRDDTSAPPSVVSSLYPNLDKLEHQQKLSELNLRQLTDLGHRQSSTPSSLWSHTPSGRSVTTRARPASPFNLPQQPAITTRRPGFNTSYFGTPRGSLGTTSRTEPSTSPFYPGRTTYGGASAQRSTNKRVRTSPYEVHLPIKRSVRPRLAKPADETDIGITSNTAKRILDTLERMSTPLSDAKRIPLSPSASPMAFSVTRTPKPRQSSRKPFGPTTRGIRLAGPPVSGLSIPRSVSIAPNTQPPIPTLAPTRSQDKPGDDVTETPVGQASSVEPSTSVSSGFFFKPLSTTPTQAPPLSRLDTTATQPTSMQRAGSNSSSGGKMKHKRSTSHYSANKDAEDDDVEVLDLPNIPLPIKTLPSFSFGKSIQPPKSSSAVTAPSASVNWTPSVSKAFSFTTSTPAVRTPTADKEPEFTFASPILKQKSTISAPEFETTEAFKFRIPKKADLSVSPNAPPTSVVNPSSTRSSSEPPAAPSATSRDTEEENDEEETGFGIKVATTLRTGSCLEVFGIVPSSEPSQEPKPVASEAPTDDIFAKFRPPAGSWKCGTCLLQNNPTALACIACQAEKPPAKASEKNPQTELTSASSKTKESNNNMGSVTSLDDMLAKFRPPPGSWKCSTCLLQNKKEATKCIACESPNPAETQKTAAPPAPTNDSLFEKFRPPPGSWKCETCLLQNKADANTCIACMAPKPNTNSGSSNPPASVNKTTLMNSTESTNSTKVDNFMDKFKPPPGSWKCDTCLIQNKETAERCIACETPKPGSQPMLKSPPASAFKFGSQSAGNFKFGGNPESTNKFQAPAPSLPTGGFKFGSGGIQFGASKDKTTSEIKFGGDNAVKTNSLGQDGKLLFGSDKTGSTESGFKFGASSALSEEKDKPALGSGFQFGSATTKSDSVAPNVDPFKSTAPSQTFKFGGSAVNAVTAETQEKNSKSEPKGFSFGSTKNDTHSSTLGSSTTEQNQSGMKFSFGENTNPPTLASQTSFKLGAGSVAPITTVPQSVEKPVYNFGADSADITKSASKTSGFSFGTAVENAVNTAAQLPHQNSVVPTFNFGKSDAGSDEAGTGQPLAKKNVTFALPVEEASLQQNKPAFSFGGPPAQKTAHQVAPFVFGATDSKVDAPSKPNGSITFGTSQSSTPAPFAFGAGNASNNSKPGGFSFSATTNQNSSPAVAGGFQFGTTTITTASTPTQQNMLAFGGFGSTTSAPSTAFGTVFGSQPTANSSPNPFSAQQPTQTTPAFGAPTGTSVFGAAPTSSFGATNSQTSTPTFGVSATGSAPGFGNAGSTFGASAMNSAAGFKPEATPAYNFGGSSTTGSSQGVFAFGGNNAQNPAPQTPSSGGFNFGQQQRAVSGFGSQNATGASSPSVFHFGSNQQQPPPPQGQNASFSSGTGTTQHRRIKKAVRRAKPRP